MLVAFVDGDRGIAAVVRTAPCWDRQEMDAAVLAQYDACAYERQLLNRALRAGGGTAAGMGASVSRIYEAHGDVAEDRNRGLLAARFAGSPASGPTVNIQNLTVQSNDAPGLVQGLQRLPETQAYNTVIR